MPMFVAVLTVEFALDGNDNLKAKRRVANSLKQKVRNRFNVAIAEAGTENSLTRRDVHLQQREPFAQPHGQVRADDGSRLHRRNDRQRGRDLCR